MPEQSTVPGLLRVEPNPVRRAHFSVGDLMREFRRGRDADPAAEDWTTSVTSPRSGGDTDAGAGRVLKDGSRVRTDEVVSADSHPYLAKLLDPDRRIPIHCHPSDEFAAAHLATPLGKAEAWIVLGVEGTGPHAWLGFRDQHTVEAVAELLSDQQPEGLLGHLTPVALQQWDVVVVPPGTPHALGPGVLVVEPQQPSDWSILLDRDAFGIDASDALLGLDPRTAATAFDGRARSPHDVERDLIARSGGRTPIDGALLAPGMRSYFTAGAITTDSVTVHHIARTTTLVVATGAAEMAAGDTVLECRAGDVLLVPDATDLVVRARGATCVVITIGGPS
jgi:mannose-6-phosphate isomerase